MAESNFPARGTVPMFPLPNTVFFPETVLPLHVFEPRYREMIRDAERADRRVAVALLQPGWESDYYGTPPVYPVATIGRIDDLVPLSDGRYNLRLVGLGRIRLLATARAAPYRVMDYRAHPESVEADAETVRSRKMELLATQMCVAREMASHGVPEMVVDPEISLAAAVNGACSSLPLDAAVRQALLDETDLLERRDKVANILDQILAQLIRMRPERPGGEGGDPVN